MCNSDTILWKIRSVNFNIEIYQSITTITYPFIETVKIFGNPTFRTHLHGYNNFIKFFSYVIVSATKKFASMDFTLFPGDLDNLLRWPFSNLIHLGFYDKLDSFSTWTQTMWLDNDPAYKQPTISTRAGISTIAFINLTPNLDFLVKQKVFWIDGVWRVEIRFANPPPLNPQTQTSLFFSFP